MTDLTLQAITLRGPTFEAQKEFHLRLSKTLIAHKYAFQSLGETSIRACNVHLCQLATASVQSQ